MEASRDMQSAKTERERKFLVLNPPPDLSKFEQRSITQCYIKAPDGTPVRYRRIGDKYFITIKTGQGEVRMEDEKPTTKQKFKDALSKSNGAVVVKHRYYIPYGGKTIELDIYEGSHAGLITAEVEFATAAQSRSFVPPLWFSREVTDNEAYGNSSLAFNGPPK